MCSECTHKSMGTHFFVEIVNSKLSCLINFESILHGIKQWLLKQFYMNTLYSWQELKDCFVVMVNLYTLLLSFSSQLQDICILWFLLFLASHIHKYMAKMVQLQQEVLTVIQLMISVAVLFLTC